MELFNVLAILVSVTALLSYINHRFVGLALSLPTGPERDLILTITYIIVVFSLIVQDLTVKPLVKKFVS